MAEGSPPRRLGTGAEAAPAARVPSRVPPEPPRRRMAPGPIQSVPRLGQDIKRGDPAPAVSDGREGPEARPVLPLAGESHSATASATATPTPGPMVELSEIFFR